MNARTATFVAALALASTGCDMFKTVAPEPSPEEAVKKIVSECQKAANARNVGALIPYVADEFVGPQGIRKQQMQQVLQGQVFRNPDLAVVFIPKLEIKPTGKQSADVVATLVFGRVKAKTVEELSRGDIAAIYRVEATAVRQEEHGWRFTTAKYDTADGW